MKQYKEYLAKQIYKTVANSPKWKELTERLPNTGALFKGAKEMFSGAYKHLNKNPFAMTVTATLLVNEVKQCRENKTHKDEIQQITQQKEETHCKFVEKTAELSKVKAKNSSLKATLKEKGPKIKKWKEIAKNAQKEIKVLEDKNTRLQKTLQANSSSWFGPIFSALASTKPTHQFDQATLAQTEQDLDSPSHTPGLDA